MSMSELPARRKGRRIRHPRGFDPPRKDLGAASGRRSAHPSGATLVEPTLDSAETGRIGHLGRVRRVGWVVFGLQLAGFVAWSTVVWQRFALTYDFWLVSQATYKVNHTGAAGGWHVITQYFDAVIVWVFALLIRLPTHGLGLLWIQDLAVVAVGLVAFLWVCEMLERPLRTGIPAHWLALLALVFLVGNPWVFETVAFDFHLEVFGTLFILLAARDLQRGQLGRSLVWVVVTLCCGFVAATYVAGLALSALVAGRGRQRMMGVGLLVGGVAGVIVLTSAGGAAAVVSFYSFLAGPHASPHLSLGGLVVTVITHPATALKTLWASHLDLIAILAPVGILGLGWGWGFGVPLVVLLADALQYNSVLRSPSFQSFPVYTFVAIGTVMVLARMSQARLKAPGRSARTYDRGNPMVRAMAGLLALITVGWAITYTPQISGTYLSVSSGAASVLRSVETAMPQNAEAIVSQGVIGRFSDRSHAEPILDMGQSLPLEAQTVWLIITPHQGRETVDPNVQLALIDAVEARGARLLVASHGVWALKWSPPSGLHTLEVPLSAT